MPLTRTAQRAAGPKDAGFDVMLDLAPEPTLPAVPIAASWNYGAQGAAGLPRPIALQPNVDVHNMARKIDSGLERARVRETAELDREIRTGAMRYSPARRQLKREPTPDQTQLMQSLHDAAESPGEYYNTQESDATPPRPVQQPVSTDSSPDVEPPLQRRLSVMSYEPLYPSPLQRAGSPRQNTTSSQSTPARHSSIDNASELSWNLERDIHEDDLQRTRPGKYRGEPHGRNITAPPRRPSGLSMLQETIEEEEEPSSDPIDEPEQIPEQIPDPPSAQSIRTWTEPVRTIIPQFLRTGSPQQSPQSSPNLPKEGQPNGWLSSMPSMPSLRFEHRDKHTSTLRRTNWFSTTFVLPVLVVIVSMALFFAFQGGLLENIHFPFSREQPPYVSPDMPGSSLVHGLNYQVNRINAQVASLSSELSIVRSEHSHDPHPTYVTDPAPETLPPRVNFLSPSLGALIDPFNTAPTVGRKNPFWKRVLISIIPFNYGIRNPLPPIAALTPWEEIGDCWCSSPRNGVTQLSVLLNHYIVPDELVVEHIAAGATLDPSVAPKDIEVWARYRVVPLDSPKGTRSFFSIFTPWRTPRNSHPVEPISSKEKGLGGYNVPGENSLHEVLMNVLRVSNPHEPPEAYSGRSRTGLELLPHRTDDIQRHCEEQYTALRTQYCD
ncbi:hypothetical protein N7462_004496 [Penicillium macrosclerotiorum]|uniref:uncharacterized protein n=1 Tax=Penicillium macrosclerotiorum TaxID=303699 RepID=UPI0025498F06|nr:uncharacterized protein N7462_004496 [Penicillium macrosclerotiorum]KAJ5690104.1 hypothetical protein N7462_004496 [Penicillium macrosclerotiorum]